MARKTALRIGATTGQLTPEDCVDRGVVVVDGGGEIVGGGGVEADSATINSAMSPLISTR